MITDKSKPMKKSLQNKDMIALVINPGTPRLFIMEGGAWGQKDHAPYNFFIIDHRLAKLVCMCKSTNYINIY